MREIEIKARVNDMSGLLVRLAQRVKLSEPVTQRDQVFGLPGQPGGDGNERTAMLVAMTFGAQWSADRGE